MKKQGLEDEWFSMATAPKDGTRILTCNVTPVLDEETGKTNMEEAVSIAYWFLGGWMEYPASPRYVQGQIHYAWRPVPKGRSYKDHERHQGFGAFTDTNHQRREK